MSQFNSDFETHSSFVNGVQFGILDSNEIKHKSVGLIKYSGIDENDKSELGGFIDQRQGVSDKRSRCQTCAGNIRA
uniref:DNA-directed RNA polymerase n=1 Tax=Panagrolaimus sp. ES5 TaxID=591445 RepID=A0AC34FXL0_9BILA